MKKWQAYLDKGTPDNPDTEDICYADTFPELLVLIGSLKGVNATQFRSLLASECTLNIWYGELAD